MVKINGLMNQTAYQYDTVKPDKEQTADKGKISSSEGKLSTKAADYLNDLRKQYSDYDFVVADAGDDYKGLVKQSSKEYTVIWSSADLERMTYDKKFAAEKIDSVKTIVSYTRDRICKECGFESAYVKHQDKDDRLNKIAVSTDDKGILMIFAELEKISEKKNPYKKGKTSERYIKEKSVMGSSVDELSEKIKSLDWDSLPARLAGSGENADYHA